MKFSELDFFSVAFSMRSIILLAVESLNSFVVFIFIRFSLLISPLDTLSPTVTYLGMLSPVNADVFSIVAPSIISPSNGIFSNGFTTMVSPILTSEGSTFSIFSPLKTFANSGVISTNFLMLSRLLSIE